MKKYYPYFLGVSIIAVIGIVFLFSYIQRTDAANPITFPINGGTGVSTLPLGALIVGNGTSSVTGTTSPTVGYIQATSTHNSIFGGFVLVGTTTLPSDVVVGNIFRVQGSLNDFLDGAVENSSNNTCATAEFDAQNNLTTLTNHFAAFGITGGNFTGSGCSNVPYTGFGPDSSYILNPNGNMNFALGTTSSAGQYRWFGQGYASSNVLMILTQNGNLGLGSTTPDSHFTISNDLTSFAIPPTNTQIHIVQNGSNARTVGDTYFTGQSGTNWQGRHARGTNLLPSAVILDDSLSLIGGYGYGTTKFTDAATGAFIVRAGGTFTDTSAPTYLSFYTTPTGSTTSVESMRVATNGNVGIATTSPYAKLSVVGEVVAANFTGTTTATSTFAGGINFATSGGCLAINGTCNLTVKNGGTGIVAYTPGDILYASNATTLSRVASSTDNTILALRNGAPAWIASTTLSTIDGTLSAAKGGTGITSYTAGSILYANSASTLSTVASTSGAGRFLTQDYTTGAPSWVATSSSGIVRSGTAGQFPFYLGSEASLIATSTLFINTTTGLLGIGTTTPAVALDVKGALVSEEGTTTTTGTPTFNWALRNQYVMVMNANVTAITFSGGIAGAGVRLILCQDTAGSRTVAGWPASVLWPAGTVPTQTATSNKCDIYPFTVTTATSSKGVVLYLGGTVQSY